MCQEDLDPLIPKDKCPDAKDAKDYKFSSRWTGVTIQIHGNKYVDNDLDGQHFIISVNSLSKFACRRLADMKWNQVDVCEEDVNDDVCGTWKTDCDDDNSLILISN